MAIGSSSKLEITLTMFSFLFGVRILNPLASKFSAVARLTPAITSQPRVRRFGSLM
ncbi:hypothetical protein Vsou_15030 [Vulcanisaeta souniana JCM 11219]|uniref:Uncharacterized protein n=1 Tax=Vulcanisaeta souniana JCM 11219 TaxID=1293586 RepID=A0ABN6SRF2_9CREN|nr:hypothetical protein Vsou_15030 [Vulcanisaeta souniana JCM 11219]